MKNKLIFKKVIRIIVLEVFFGKKNGFIVVKKKDYIVSRKECWSIIFSVWASNCFDFGWLYFQWLY